MLTDPCLQCSCSDIIRTHKATAIESNGEQNHSDNNNYYYLFIIIIIMILIIFQENFIVIIVIITSFCKLLGMQHQNIMKK